VRSKIAFAVLAFGISLMVSVPIFAHHSMAMYDSDRDVTYKATITQFQWANPHTQIVFTAPDDRGNPSKDTLKPGDQVTIIGNPNRDGSPTMRFVKVTLPNGQTLEGRRR